MINKFSLLSLLNHLVVFVMFANWISAAPRTAQFPFGTDRYGGLLAVENGYLIFLKESTSQLQARAVHIVNSLDETVTSLDPLSQVDGARDLAIWDVSVGKSGLTAVAVVAVDQMERMVPLLMVYNLTGTLLNVQKLEPSMEIAQLCIDDQDAIWAVGRGPGNRDPGAVSMFFKFTDQGRSVEGLFPRSLFSDSGRTTKSLVPNSGVLSFGVSRESVWCWLPTSKELVLFDRIGLNLQRLVTELPVSSDPEIVAQTRETRVLATFLTDSGHLVSQVAFSTQDRRSTRTHFYRWDWEAGNWRELPNFDESDGLLVGIDGSDLIVARVQGPISLTWKPIDN